MNIPNVDMEALLDAAQTSGCDRLEAVVRKAANRTELSLGIYFLRREALCILAHEAFNSSEQHGTPLNEWLAQLMNDLRLECHAIATTGEDRPVKINTSGDKAN